MSLQTSPLSRPNRPFGAVLTAMVTPMTADGAVDIDAAVAVAEHLVATGHDGIVLSGTTGESPTTHSPDKIALVREVVKAVGDRAKIVAGAGSNDTAHSQRMASDAAAAGADGLLVVTPYYNRPSQEGVLAHVRAIADTTELPVMLYDIPGRTGLRLAHDTICRLAEHQRVVAVKDATGDVYGAAQMMARTNLAYYSGDDPLNLAFLALGAVGVVSVIGHVQGPELVNMVRAVDAGDLAAARAAFQRTLPIIEAIMGKLPGAVMAKAALQLTGVLAERTVRLPLVPASDEDVVELRAAMVGAGLLGN